jgi:hypothetical protein
MATATETIIRLEEENRRLRAALNEIANGRLWWVRTAEDIARKALAVNEQNASKPCPVCDGVGEHKWNCTLNR